MVLYLGAVIWFLFHVPVPEVNSKVLYFFLGSVFGGALVSIFGYFFTESHKNTGGGIPENMDPLPAPPIATPLKPEDTHE